MNSNSPDINRSINIPKLQTPPKLHPHLHIINPTIRIIPLPINSIFITNNIPQKQSQHLHQLHPHPITIIHITHIIHHIQIHHSSVHCHRHTHKNRCIFSRDSNPTIHRNCTIFIINHTSTDIEHQCILV